MKIPEKFGIWITQRCPLRCSFCANSDQYFKSGSVMSLKTFQEKVDEIVESGVSVIDLTPIVGEVLTIPRLSEYLDYMDSIPAITEYTFISCLVCPRKGIDSIADRPKLQFEISLYGTTPETFKKRTNVNTFSTFYKNFKYLLSQYKNKNKIIIINRTPEEDGPLLNQPMSTGMRYLIGKCSIDEEWVTDRDNYVEEQKSGTHHCHFMSEPLLTDNGICFCCMDWNKSSVIPDKINGMYGDSDKFISKIDSVSDTCNKKCGWYRPPNS